MRLCLSRIGPIYCLKAKS
ncbi:UNVERIFIED_CONTAM: hypothetical protein GTU68_026766 [Idotea baltica]|nr:hypothetical protein [Idotea baltica]